MTNEAHDIEPPMTVGRLREVLSDQPDERLVVIHFGWDVDIVTVDTDDNEVTLFADDERIATVSREYLDRVVALEPFAIADPADRALVAKALTLAYRSGFGRDERRRLIEIAAQLESRAND